MSFRKELETLINSHSMENGSDTPDFILAQFMSDCLTSFDNAVNARNDWYKKPDGQLLEQIKASGNVIEEPSDPLGR